MTATRALALFLTVILAGAFARAAGPAGAATTEGPRLTTISAKAHRKGASLVIEASAPVPYVATRPDPLTLLVDFRNVGSDGVANQTGAAAKGPIAGVTVEPVESMGSPAARVRIALAQPVAYRVRAERNTVVVDFDKPSGKAAPYVLPPLTRELPDAMKALELADTADPVAALTSPGAPARPPVAIASEMSAPVTAQAAQAAQAAAAAKPEAPGQSGAGAAQSAVSAERKYSGHPISLDFQGADLRAVLRTFAEISGLNIVIDPKVTGTVDVALRDVPWDQALDIILRANNLGYSLDGTIVRIVPVEVLANEEKQRSDLAKAQAEAGQIRTFTRQLSYAKGEDIAALLKSANILSNRGQAFVDARTNTLIVTDLADRITATGTLLDTLDKPQPQVEIEARIVQTNKNYARALGVQWGLSGRADPALGNTTPLAFPNSGTLNGRAGAGGSNTVVNLGANAATSAIGLALGSVNGAFNLDVALSALETTGNGRILSTPRVSTQNNVEAEITQGVQIPIQTIANNTVTVTFKDAALTLKVTPQITSAGTVIMKISVENASPDYTRSVNNIPPINTQRAITQVLVSDGQTTVIGGIYASQEQSQADRTPGLSRLPLLKWLFRRDSVNDTSTELLIFITPRILKG